MSCVKDRLRLLVRHAILVYATASNFVRVTHFEACPCVLTCLILYLVSGEAAKNAEGAHQARLLAEMGRTVASMDEKKEQQLQMQIAQREQDKLDGLLDTADLEEEELAEDGPEFGTAIMFATYGAGQKQGSEATHGDRHSPTHESPKANASPKQKIECI